MYDPTRPHIPPENLKTFLLKTYPQEIKKEPFEAILMIPTLGFLPFLFAMIAFASLGAPGWLQLIAGLGVGIGTAPMVFWLVGHLEWKQHQKVLADHEALLREALAGRREHPQPSRLSSPVRPTPSPSTPSDLKPKFSGRKREKFQITGSPEFVADVNWMLDYVRDRAPHRYIEILENLPKAEQRAHLGGNSASGYVIGRSDGLFVGDINRWGREFFLFVFLHETGHNVLNHDSIGGDVEAEANTYARQVMDEIGRP